MSQQHQLDDETIAKAKAFFNKADKDKSGSVSKEELINVMKELGFKGDRKEIDEIFAAADHDGDGNVSYEEFMRTILGLPPKTVAKARLRKAFKILDKNNDGYVDAKELAQIMAEQQQKVSKEEIENMIKKADLDKDGKVSFEEILALWDKQ